MIRRSAFARLSDPADPLTAALFEGAAGGLLAADAAGLVRRANPAMLGWAGDALGRPAWSVFHPGDRAAAEAALAPVLAGLSAGCEIASARLPGEAAGPFRVTASALRGRRGRTEGMLLALADLGPLRRAQSEADAMRRLHAVGRLASGIAHDFNNLLTVIAGAAAEASARPGAGPEALEDARLIADAAGRGAELVRRMLGLGREQAAAAQVVRLNPAVRALAALTRRSLGAGIRLELELEEPGRAALIDPAQLDQALVNLLFNARDAMPSGGAIRLRTGHVTLLRPESGPGGEAPPGRYALIEVRDDGGGIAADILPRIFEPAFTTRSGQGGHGLGLASVQAIARQAGGFVGVDSAPGRTAFRLCLPAHAPPTEEAGPPPSAPGRTVLLVEDEDSVRRLAERVLTQRGWTVLADDSAESALARTADDLARVDAVVTDAEMPGMDGRGLIRRLRGSRPGLPAVLTSGYAQPAAEPDIRFLLKPYTPDALARALEQAAAAAASSP